jgi:hypothetical protein
MTRRSFPFLLRDWLANNALRSIHNGLVGYYNPVIAKALLANHGYREGIEGKSGREVAPLILNKFETDGLP